MENRRTYFNTYLLNAFFFLLVFSAPSQILAALCSPTGQLKVVTAMLVTCDGNGNLGSAGTSHAYLQCNGSELGKMKYMNYNYYWCDGVGWSSLFCMNTGNACSAPGTMHVNSGSGLHEYCNGANWITIDTTLGCDANICSAFVSEADCWRGNCRWFDFGGSSECVDIGPGAQCSHYGTSGACNADPECRWDILSCVPTISF